MHCCFGWFFPLRVDAFSEETWCAGKQQEVTLSQKLASLAENQPVPLMVASCLNILTGTTHYILHNKVISVCK